MKEPVEIKPPPPGVEIRYTELGDSKYLKEWLLDPEVGRWFPMADEIEIEDAVSRWISFYRYKCSLTAIKDGIPCGIITLYLQPYRKLAHQCQFGIIVDNKHRNQGVGSLLLRSGIHLAKETFRIELLHLEVYAENPAKRLYERFGFSDFGFQGEWLKEDEGHYRGRTFMQKSLLQSDL